MSKAENIEKLKNLIQNANDRFAELSHQWEQVKTPLLEEIKLLQDSHSIKETKYQEDQNRFGDLRDTYNKLSKDLKDKTALEETLTKKCQTIPSADKR